VIRFGDACPPADENAVQAFESRYGVQIPPAYLSFLLANDGARPEPNMLSGTSWEQGMVAVVEFLGLSGTTVESIYNVRDDYGDRLPRGWFSFATAVGGNLLVLAIAGPGYGRVAFWDHELEGEPEALTVVADTFDEFLERLAPATY
jgi:hypothetical protein